MSFKDVLVHAESGATAERRLQYAIEFARQQGAHLSGLFVVEPLHLGAYFTPPAASYVDVAALEEIDRKHREAETKVASAIEAKFRDLCMRAGVGSEWHVVVGDPVEQITLNARCADLTIIGQIDPDHLPSDAADHLPEQTAISSGRPSLVFPYAGDFDTVGRNVLVAWAHTRESARAANDAGLGVNAGHDLNLDNLGKFLAEVPGVLEVSIGHALIADALEMGLYNTVKEYLKVLSKSNEHKCTR